VALLSGRIFVIKSSELGNVCHPSTELMKGIAKLLTPKSITEMTSFEDPILILPTNGFTDHVSILERRDDIQNLRCLQVKSNEMHLHYHQFEQQDLLKNLLEEMGTEPFILKENDFPYLLPSEIKQYIAWYQPYVTDAELIRYLAQVVLVFNLDLNKLILFNRPMGTKVKYIKPSFPVLGHVHFWMPQTS
jgi:hypothetical protein